MPRKRLVTNHPTSRLANFANRAGEAVAGAGAGWAAVAGAVAGGVAAAAR